MAVGGVKGGGRRGGPSGAGGAKGAGGAGKAFRVDGADGAGKAESLVGASGAAGSSEVGGAKGVGGADPITASLNQIAKELASGAIANKSEATRKAVETILQKKGLLGGKGGKGGKGSKKMVDQIADTLESDPRLAAALERTWQRAGNK